MIARLKCSRGNATLSGAGTLTPNGASTYTGATTVGGGILQISANNAPGLALT